MNNLQMMEQEKSVLRWGGLAGILGGILFILSMVVAGVIIGPNPTDLTGWVVRFPDIHMLRFVENSLYLLALILGIPVLIALYWHLRKTGLAPALFGSSLGIVGLIAMIVSATPHIAHYPLSELYHSAMATPETQATIAILWQATWGIFNAPLYVGFFVGNIGFALLGGAIFNSPDFGKGLGWMSIVLGVAGLVAAVFQMIDPASSIGMVSFFAYIIFYFVLGIKIYRISKSA